MLSGYNSLLDSRALKSKSSGQFCFNSLATSGLIVRFYFSLLVRHMSVRVYPAEIFLLCTCKSYIINFGENQQFVSIIVNDHFYVCI